MKLKLEMIAVAAAMTTLAGGAQAAIVTSGESGTLVLAAFNTVTNDWYLRDLGYTLSSFLPSGALNSVGTAGSTIVGDKTPTAGLTLNSPSSANFADASFSAWFAPQIAANVVWFVNAVDSINTAGVSRFITSSMNTAETASNGQISNFVGTPNAGGLDAFFGSATGISTTGTAAGSSWATNFGLGADGLAQVGQSASLFYFTRGAGTSGTLQGPGRYGNGTDFASVTLASNGDFTYQLNGASAVPLPAAAWLLGAGLLGLGGAARRRKAAAQAEVA